MELYVHIPFCMKKCKYCDFLSGPYGIDIRKKYTDALLKEIAFYGEKCRGEKISSLFLGGGTPTFLEAEYLEKILNRIKEYFSFDKDCEATIECNPGTASYDAMVMYRDNGLNRISIGLQSANNDELSILGRVHDYNSFLRTYEYARKAGFDNVNIDIMTGLPQQNLKKLRHTLSAVTMLRPEHISAYDLIIEPGTPFYDLYSHDLEIRRSGMGSPRYLPDEETQYALTEETESYLSGKGYIQYEVSNFAKEGYESRHNTGYWDRVPYIGLGIGSASLYKECRWSNDRDIYKYMDYYNGKTTADIFNSKAPWTMEDDEASESEASHLYRNLHRLSRKEAMEEFFFLGLRKVKGVKRRDFESYFGTTVEAIYADVLRKLKSEELLYESAGYIALTERGMDVSNQVLAEFLLD